MNKFRKLSARALYAVMALALVVGLTLAPAVGADSPAVTDVGFELGAGPDTDTAEWSVAQKGADDAMGNYSVELVQAGDAAGTHGGTYIQLIPPSGITFANFETDITDADDEWSFWDYKVTTTTSNWAQFELKFTDPADSDEYVDIMFTQHSLTGGAAWEKVTVDKDVVSFLYWGPNIGSANPDELQNFANLLSGTSSKSKVLGDGDYDDYLLTRVQVQLYEATPARTSYIDDITIAGTTYELEPIFLDAEYYSVGDTVVVTVPNFAANTDSIRVNPVTAEIGTADWEVTVTSASDTSGITVALEETGIDTGVFTGSFTTVGTSPDEDELKVQDGDAINVGYIGDWGTTSAQTIVPYTLAEVDDTEPTITGLTPTDGAQITETLPTIEASYSDDPTVSDINIDSVEILVDGVDVTEDTTPLIGSVTYTPTEDLADGTHDVTVNVSDNAGNTATESWSFSVVSWLVDQESNTSPDDFLDALDTVGVAVSGATGATDTGDIKVGRYASNPEPDATPPSDLIEDPYFDVRVIDDGSSTQIVIKFADDNITADSVAYVWDALQGMWLACSDQGYNSVDEYLWVKVRTNTTPNIAELTGTPFAISGKAAAETKGDFDVDGDIDIVDFVYFAEAYGSVSTDANYNVIGDFDDDGDIDLIDFVQFATVYGT